MANISLIFEDVESGKKLETYLNSRKNIIISVYDSIPKESEYYGSIELDIDTVKAFIKQLNKVIKKARNAN
jgi:hypothetical protein